MTSANRGAADRGRSKKLVRAQFRPAAGRLGHHPGGELDGCFDWTGVGEGKPQLDGQVMANPARAKYFEQEMSSVPLCVCVWWRARGSVALPSVRGGLV